MTPNRAHEVLYESEAALRLVDHELLQLHDIHAAGHDLPEPGSSDSAYSIVVSEANQQILSALATLRERKAMQPLSDASELLNEMERRMTEVAALLHPTAGLTEPLPADDAIFTPRR